MGKGFTHEKYLSQLAEKGIQTKPIEQYKSGKQKFMHLCVCGREWNVRSDTVLRGLTCGCRQEEGLAIGRGHNIKSHEEYLRNLKNKNIKVLPKESYINSGTKILHECVCGDTWSVTPEKVLMGQNCSKCKRIKIVNKQVKGDQIYKEQLINNNIDAVPLEPYIGVFKKIKHRCKCGNEWNVTPNNILSGFSTCGCEVSKGELIINRWLKEMKINFKPQVSFEDLRGERGAFLKYDFGIYKGGELFCLVEYQGRQHFVFVEKWHKTKEIFKKSQNRDKKKREYAKRNSIPLIEIHYKDKKPLVTLERYIDNLGYFDLFTTIVG